jgi:hypothetical protein
MLWQVPPEILHLVLGYLRRRDILEVCSTCRAVRSVGFRVIRSAKVPIPITDRFHHFVHLDFDNYRWEGASLDLVKKSGVLSLTNVHLRGPDDRALEGFDALETLGITVYGATGLQTLSSTPPTLQSLRLKAYDTSREDLTAAMLAATSKSNLKHLTLSCRWRYACTRHECLCHRGECFLTELLQMPLETLDLDVPCTQQCELLAPCTLRSLTVRDCYPHPGLLQASYLQSLRHLSLHDTSSVALLPFFRDKACPPLESFSVVTSWRSDRGIEGMSDILVAMSNSACELSLRRLHLQRQVIELCCGVLAIAKFNGLTSLTLPGLRLAPRLISSFCCTLVRCTNLEEVDLSDVCVDIEHNWSVTLALKSLPRLRSLDLSCSSMLSCNILRAEDLLSLLHVHRERLRVLNVNRTICRINTMLTIMPRMPSLVRVNLLSVSPNNCDIDCVEGLTVLQQQAPGLMELTLMAPEDLIFHEDWARAIARFRCLETLEVRIPKAASLYNSYDLTAFSITQTLGKFCDKHLRMSIW